MTSVLNPLAPHQLPAFIVGPDGSDTLLFAVGLFVLTAVFATGLVFLWLHSLPERMAHKGQKLQFEAVAVLCMLALFTHNNVFWVIALLLAIVDLPDMTTPLNRIASAAEAFTAKQESGTAAPLEQAQAESETAMPVVTPPAVAEDKTDITSMEADKRSERPEAQDNA